MTATVIGAIFLLTILTLLTPTIDRILTNDVLDVIDQQLNNLEYFIGSDNLNTFLIIITITLIIILYKRANKFFHGTD